MRRIPTNLWIAGLCVALYGQTAFEAASVKPAVPLGPLGMRSDQTGGPGTPDPGLFSCKNCSLYWLLSDAYRFHGYDFFGPDWLQSIRYDVSAKVPAGAGKEEFQLMMQNLLAERFKLAVHREKRQMQVLELTVGKGGPKFRESAPKEIPRDDGPRQPLKQDADGFPILTPGTTMAIRPGHARIHLDGEPVASLVSMLSGQLQMPVIDATGLAGKYEFLVSWAWDDTGGLAARNEMFSSLVDAVERQLGLKLEQKKGQVEVLVVDRIEKAPTEN